MGTKDKKAIYPYFDIGLGRTVTGPAHRRRVMRELNVEEVGNEVDQAIREITADQTPVGSGVSRDEFEQKFAQIKLKMTNPDYKAYHSGIMTPRQRERFEHEWRRRFGDDLGLSRHEDTDDG